MAIYIMICAILFSSDYFSSAFLAKQFFEEVPSCSFQLPDFTRHDFFLDATFCNEPYLLNYCNCSVKVRNAELLIVDCSKTRGKAKCPGQITIAEAHDFSTEIKGMSKAKSSEKVEEPKQTICPSECANSAKFDHTKLILLSANIVQFLIFATLLIYIFYNPFGFNLENKQNELAQEQMEIEEVCERIENFKRIDTPSLSPEVVINPQSEGYLNVIPANKVVYSKIRHSADGTQDENIYEQIQL